MSDFKQAQLMLRMARKDFKALKGMMDIEIFEEEIFGFHAQQTYREADSFKMKELFINA